MTAMARPKDAQVTVSPDGSGVQIRFEPRMDAVAGIRIFLSDFVRGVVGGVEAAGRMEIAVQELVENAVKGASEGSVSVELSLHPDQSEVEARIETVNRATRWNIACLRRAVEEFQAITGSPQDVYVELMKRSLAKPTGSGLGIGRVRAEAEMEIVYDIDGDRVKVTAATRFPKEPV